MSSQDSSIRGAFMPSKVFDECPQEPRDAHIERPDSFEFLRIATANHWQARTLLCFDELQREIIANDARDKHLLLHTLATTHATLRPKTPAALCSKTC